MAFAITFFPFPFLDKALNKPSITQFIDILFLFVFRFNSLFSGLKPWPSDGSELAQDCWISSELFCLLGLYIIEHYLFKC